MYKILLGTGAIAGGGLVVVPLLGAPLGVPDLFWMLGVPLFGACALPLWYETQPPSRTTPRAVGVGVAIVANALVAVSTVGFWFLPRGMVIRPMAWAFLIAEIAGVAAMIVSGVAMNTVARGERVKWAYVALPLAVLSFWFGGAWLRLAAGVKGLVLAD